MARTRGFPENRGWFALVVLWLFMPAVCAAQGAWTPENNVEIIVGTGPGSSPDKVARLVQKIFQEQRSVSTPLTVVNKPGGNNSIGFNYLNQHPGDGHYLMIGVINLSLGVLTGRSSIGPRDVTPVSLLFNEYTALIVRPDSPIKSAKDFVDRLKKDPTSVSLGVSTATGGANHLAIAIPLKEAGIEIRKIRTIAFNSGGANVTALLGGHIDAIVISPSVVISQLASNHLRALATISPERLGGPYANVPTLRETGLKTALAKYRSIIGPKGMKPEQVAYWEARFAKLSENSDWKKQLDTFQWDGKYMNGKDLKVLIEDMHTQIESVLLDLGMIKR